eukprot:gnl/MRDRNA2_/MRDRNA2_298047_c0_seq1.p1 gnl/MRDRNA2_/MRDRNA2_298047_c0~~gnl/MRDRNA2_/MRDRNA2_298047_c0_seq1.p1  ORF type:complete len:115 (+),score=12.77 gnl/MRDRNA2_/MRDRNA2_298047_c0_seq1:153-497(+)
MFSIAYFRQVLLPSMSYLVLWREVSSERKVCKSWMRCYMNQHFLMWSVSAQLSVAVRKALLKIVGYSNMQLHYCDACSAEMFCLTSFVTPQLQLHAKGESHEQEHYIYCKKWFV